jgi:hypothetical protein
VENLQFGHIEQGKVVPTSIESEGKARNGTKQIRKVLTSIFHRSYLFSKGILYVL